MKKKELKSGRIEVIVTKCNESKREEDRGESGITKPDIMQNRQGNKTRGQEEYRNKEGKGWGKEEDESPLYIHAPSVLPYDIPDWGGTKLFDGVPAD